MQFLDTLRVSASARNLSDNCFVQFSALKMSVREMMLFP